jgi:N-acetylmuramoyl-L-alanine amidase
LKDRNPRRCIARIGALALLPVLCASSLARVTHSQSWAGEKFAAAEQLRQTLAGRAQNERTRHEYQHVINAYRRVYLGCPICTKADPSVVATAELLLEMGRQFGDDAILRSAIKQYQFLRREYPGSKSRAQALFNIGDIYRNDLDEPSQARAAFQEFLKHYSKSSLADDVRHALTELDQDSHEEVADKRAKRTTSAVPKKDEDNNGEDDTQTPSYTRVTGILHWSSSDSARVSIDLDREVQFKSERLQHPSRIYFDLRDTQLAAGLAGKTFDVQGVWLKRIRVAQFEQGRSRVVLEIDPHADYKAFLLPNPNRLIIDIQGASATKVAATASKTLAHPMMQGPQSIEVPAEHLVLKPVVTEASPDRPAAWVDAQRRSTAGVAEPKPIPTRIVEADDDDEDETAIPPRVQSKRPTKTSAESKPHEAPGVGKASNRRKQRSADGNDDEVATLGAPEVRAAKTALPSSAPPISAIPVTSKGASLKRSRTKQDTAVLDMREAQPTMAGDRSLIRALGLKIGRIVIDPGHGGHDTGTIGPNRVEEKNVVLDVARRLGKLLQGRMGADVVFTRQDDSFIPLETRTAIANEQQADLFVSIHANSSRDEDARGVETYYLNFTSNAAALEVAARENASSDQSIHELQDLVKKIALKEKIEESREFATDVQRSLHTGLALKNPGIRDRGVKKAPFVVLIGANMPSILAEISFVSNPTDERKLDTPEYRQRIAESLYKGIAKYVNGLSGVKVASRMAKSDGQ